MPLVGLSWASFDKDGDDYDKDVVDDGDDNGDVMVMQSNNLGTQEERVLVLQDPHRPFQPDHHKQEAKRFNK